MNQLTREHKPQAVAAGMWIGLWAGEIMLAGEYWLARGASLAFGTARAWLRRPVLYFSIAAMAAFGTLMAVNVNNMLKGAQFKTAQLDQRAVMNGVDLYETENGRLPARLEDLVPKYIRELHSDPWGNPYAYYRGEGGSAIVSAGPDGKLGTGDDIVVNEGAIK
jgi:hypothetical protein